MLFRHAFILLTFIAIGSPEIASAQETSKPDILADAVTLSNHELRSIVINSDPTFDWIKLTSGEWLKGRVELMLDESLEFDSDELDVQSFDWEDVEFLYSPKLNGISTEDRTTDYGTLLIDSDSVTVTSGVTNTYPRSTILGIAPGGPREVNYWSGDISVGLSLRQGNVDQVDYTATMGIRRITPRTRMTFNYLGNVSKVNGIENANNHRGTLNFDVFVSKRLFVRVPFIEYYRDPFVNIDYRLTGGAGLGYDIVDTSKIDWNATLGPGFQVIRNESVQPGQEIEQRHLVGTAATTFEWEINSNLDWTINYSATLGPESAGGLAQHFMTKLEYELSSYIDLETSFVADTLSSPQPDENNVVPQKTDVRLVFGIGVEF